MIKCIDPFGEIVVLTAGVDDSTTAVSTWPVFMLSTCLTAERVSAETTRRLCQSGHRWLYKNTEFNKCDFMWLETVHTGARLWSDPVKSLGVHQLIQTLMNLKDPDSLWSFDLPTQNQLTSSQTPCVIVYHCVSMCVIVCMTSVCVRITDQSESEETD